MKKALTLLASVGAIALLGAGCSGNPVSPSSDQNDVSSTTETTTSTTSTTDNNQATNSGDFTVTVNALGNGKVQVDWTVPSDVDTGASFRVLHSARQNPVFNSVPDPKTPNAYWFQIMNSARSTELSNVPTGHRYFRVCEFKNNECEKYSDVAEADVK